MKAPDFNYIRVDSTAQALSAFHEDADDPLYIAGGQSVLASLNLRLQAPSLLIDISSIPELSGITLIDGYLKIGAMTRHSAILSDPLVKTHAPLLSKAAHYIAHPAIRNLGTIGGSVALGDPAAEFPAMLLALNAQIELESVDGTRFINANDFYHDLFETEMNAGEILKSISIPLTPQNTHCEFDELTRRKGDFAIVGAGIQTTISLQKSTAISIAFFSVANTPVRARNVEEFLLGKKLDGDVIKIAKDLLAKDIDPIDALELPSSMRLHLAQVLLGRLLTKLKHKISPAGTKN